MAPDESSRGRSSVALSSCRRPRDKNGSVEAQRRAIWGSDPGAYHSGETNVVLACCRGGRDGAPIRLKFFAAEGSVIRLYFSTLILHSFMGGCTQMVTKCERTQASILHATNLVAIVDAAMRGSKA